MKNIRINKILTLCMFSISFIAILVIQAIALEVETHKAINSYIADENSVVYGSYLNNYLKSNLGIEDGVKATFNSKMVKEWISDGGLLEDKPSGCVPYLRSRNHFHNPIDNSGFSGWWNTGIISGMSAISWINKPVNTQSCGYYSWNDARKYYYAALTAPDKAVRETNFADTFRALGQSMHLVQDMSVPEHTRNDGHYFFFDYEVWAKGLKVGDYSPKLFTPNDSFPLTINNLFDTTQYNGANPDITTQAAIGLAEYSNANFLSPGHIFTGFDYPAYIGLTARIETDPNTGKSKVYLNKTGNGEDIAYLARTNSFFNYLPVNYKRYGLTLDDEKVYKNYAAKLIPRAIGYSSQVLSYFFRGQLEVEMGDGNLKVKNASAETISGGTFELYYDNANGERNKVTITDGAAVSSLAPGGNPQTITFSPPPDGAASYMLVYSGTLGNETYAVVGKFIPAENELVVITVVLNGIAGETLTKKSVLVWHSANNSLEKAPIDYTDADFQTWYQARTNVSENMFSDFALDSVIPYKLNPELINVLNVVDYHSMPHGDTSLYLYKIFPESRYATVDSHLQPPVYTGLRTEDYIHSDKKIYCCLDMPKSGDVGAWADIDVTDWPSNYTAEDVENAARAQYPGRDYYIYEGAQKIIETKTHTYKFITPYGEINSFISTEHSETYGTKPNIIIKYFIPEWGTAYYQRSFWNSDWSDEKLAILSKARYSSHMSGRFSQHSIANIWMIQYTPCDYAAVSKSTGKYDESWAFSSRVIQVHAQSIYRCDSVAGIDWVAEGRNTELETQIKAAIEMAYTLNGISANEIREASISIQIVK